MDGPQPQPETIRVVVAQPALPKYRIPVFRELASRPGIGLTVTYGSDKHLENRQAEGFSAVPVRQRMIGRGRLHFFWDASAIRNADRRSADVLVLGWNTRSLSLPIAAKKARKRGLGVVLWGHGFSKSEAGWRRRLRDKVGVLADSVMFYNRSAASRFREASGRTDDVFVALNTLDTGPIRQAAAWWAEHPDELEAFKNKHGIAGPMVLFVSRLLEDNKIDMLFEAASKLGEEFPDLKVAVVGGGPDRERLEHRAKALGVESCVLMPGPVYDERELAAWFLASSVFCYPVNIGLSILHAMAYGLPVVTSDDIPSHNPEIEALRDGENGLLYADGSVSDMAAKLRAVIADSDLRSKLGREAERTALEEFTLERMVDGMEGAIRLAWAKARDRRSEG